MSDECEDVPYKIPSYKIYKVEDVPLLMKTQKALQAQGLCDPWLRNEVWRYTEKEFLSEKSRFRKTFFSGLGIGIVLTILTVVGTTFYEKYTKTSENEVCDAANNNETCDSINNEVKPELKQD
ncbi:NADH dehydrogenase [ubiquinone] 1 beta subcomplex subunit 3-like [Onthophagus taurus]|uniref:NADH dehydrogenase [ubiquinone] 1 beta subcomplex subunit 3-like n=1 Tax=Onthophagus taurus TaxID=166361 RepID=UPI000C20726C|nr:NADH dehydrogenase [ubiquinone] 1 beta subcomplex subunit 3-like [Onthophagus taurus]